MYKLLLIITIKCDNLYIIRHPNFQPHITNRPEIGIHITYDSHEK